MNRLDTYILSRLHANRLTWFTRLLYAIRRPWLCWHLASSRETVLHGRPVRFYAMRDEGRHVDTGASLREGVRRARARCYYDGSEG